MVQPAHNSCLRFWTRYFLTSSLAVFAANPNPNPKTNPNPDPNPSPKPNPEPNPGGVGGGWAGGGLGSRGVGGGWAGGGGSKGEPSVKRQQPTQLHRILESSSHVKDLLSDPQFSSLPHEPTQGSAAMPALQRRSSGRTIFHTFGTKLLSIGSNMPCNKRMRKLAVILIFPYPTELRQPVVCCGVVIHDR